VLDNCPNCGAPRLGAACEYCGTAFLSSADILEMMQGKDVYMMFLHEGHIHAAKVNVRHMQLDREMDIRYADSYVYRTYAGQNKYVMETYLKPVDDELIRLAAEMQKLYGEGQ